MGRPAAEKALGKEPLIGLNCLEGPRSCSVCRNCTYIYSNRSADCDSTFTARINTIFSNLCKIETTRVLYFGSEDENPRFYAVTLHSALGSSLLYRVPHQGMGHIPVGQHLGKTETGTKCHRV